ncbi:MAG: hypothetical protein ABW252_10740 [Polyangiales bacterium]
MGFRDLFKKRPLSELVRDAEQLFTDARFGEAKLAFDRVAERAAREDAAVAKEAEARASACCDRIAEERGAYAAQLFRDGERDLAKDELRHALDVARSDDVVGKLTALKDRFEAKPVARAAAAEVAPLADEERLMLLTASWEPAQAEELEALGEPLLEALLQVDRAPDDALARLEQLRAASAAPCYLWLELARAHAARKDEAASEASLRSFLGALGDDAGGAARLAAHRELARVAHARGAHDDAVAELEAAAEALSDDPRPYYELGTYLRQIDRPRDALEVLMLAARLFPEGKIEWPVRLEIGLAYADLGDSARATALLEEVLEGLLQQGERDLPPAGAEALAKLHEASGNLVRAADLYRALTLGSDLENKARYHGEAARLLDALGLTAEATRMRATGAVAHAAVENVGLPEARG